MPREPPTSTSSLLNTRRRPSHSFLSFLFFSNPNPAMHSLKFSGVLCHSSRGPPCCLRSSSFCSSPPLFLSSTFKPALTLTTSSFSSKSKLHSSCQLLCSSYLLGVLLEGDKEWEMLAAADPSCVRCCWNCWRSHGKHRATRTVASPTCRDSADPLPLPSNKALPLVSHADPPLIS